MRASAQTVVSERSAICVPSASLHRAHFDQRRAQALRGLRRNEHVQQQQPGIDQVRANALQRRMAASGSVISWNDPAGDERRRRSETAG